MTETSEAFENGEWVDINLHYSVLPEDVTRSFFKENDSFLAWIRERRAQSGFAVELDRELENLTPQGIRHLEVAVPVLADRTRFAEYSWLEEVIQASSDPRIHRLAKHRNAFAKEQAWMATDPEYLARSQSLESQRRALEKLVFVRSAYYKPGVLVEVSYEDSNNFYTKLLETYVLGGPIEPSFDSSHSDWVDDNDIPCTALVLRCKNLLVGRLDV
jgi:hypothetical protein